MGLKIGISSGDRIAPTRSQDGLPHWGGSGWARLGQYIPFLEEDGNEVYLGTLVWNRDRFSIDVSDGDSVFVDPDVVYIQRLMHNGLADHMKMARQAGQVVLNDLDDWYWGLSTSNLAYFSSHPKFNERENTNHYKSVLNASDVVTVSTQYLADRISSFVRCPIEVIPNYVDTKRFSQIAYTDTDTPLVGWVGSTAHRSGDLETLSGILPPMVRRHEIDFIHSGYHPMAPSAASAMGLLADEIQTRQAVDPENYPSLLVMDVGIAPLKDTPFNHAKSDIKLLEYSSSGIPWVASSLSSYSALSKSWGLGRVATRPKDWIKHLSSLRDPSLRKEEGQALFEISKTRDISIGAKEITSLIHSLSMR